MEGLWGEAERSMCAGNGLEHALTEQKSVASPADRPSGWERWKSDGLQSADNMGKLQGYYMRTGWGVMV